MKNFSPNSIPWGTIIIATAIIIAVFFLYQWYSAPAETPKEKTGSGQRKEQHLLPVEALVLMVDRQTPFADNINYAFELDTQGDAISLRIPTIKGDMVVRYSGKGELQLPLQTRKKGLVYITSLTPGKEARVRIWKVVNVLQ